MGGGFGISEQLVGAHCHAPLRYGFGRIAMRPYDMGFGRIAMRPCDMGFGRIAMRPYENSHPTKIVDICGARRCAGRPCEEDTWNEKSR